MPRYTGPGRFTAQGGNALSRSRIASLQAAARKIVGDLENQVKLGGIWYGRRTIKINDIASVIATVDATFPDNPIVQARIHLTGEEVRKEQQQQGELDVYIGYTTFLGGSNIGGVSTSASLTKLTFSNSGELTHNWSYDFDIYELCNTSISSGSRWFTVREDGGFTLLGSSTLFSPVIEGFWDCWTEAQRLPTTFVETIQPQPVFTFQERGSPDTYLLPGQAYEPVSGNCSGRFTTPSTLLYKDAGHRWHAPSDLYRGLENNLIVFATSLNTAWGVDAYKLGQQSVALVHTISIPQPETESTPAPLGGQQDSDGIIFEFFGNGEPNDSVPTYIVRYDPADDSMTLFNNFPKAFSNMGSAVTDRALYAIGEENIVGQNTDTLDLYRLDKSTMASELMFSYQINTDSRIAGLVMAENERYFLVVEQGPLTALNVIRIFGATDSGSFEQIEVLPMPINGFRQPSHVQAMSRTING